MKRFEKLVFFNQIEAALILGKGSVCSNLATNLDFTIVLFCSVKECALFLSLSSYFNEQGSRTIFPISSQLLNDDSFRQKKTLKYFQCGKLKANVNVDRRCIVLTKTTSYTYFSRRLQNQKHFSLKLLGMIPK